MFWIGGICNWRLKKANFTSSYLVSNVISCEWVVGIHA